MSKNELFDTGDVSKLDLGEGNWIEVNDTKTVAANENYLRILSGGKIQPGQEITVDAVASQRAKVATRVTGWHIAAQRKDGTPVELPFSPINVVKFTPALLSRVSKFIDELDAPILAATGQDDPNSSGAQSETPSEATPNTPATSSPQG